jgi:branched-chain amino acid transport system permease protein
MRISRPKRGDWLRSAVAGFLCAAAVLFLVFCPFFLSSYWLRILTHTFMFAVLAQAINIIAGYAGYPAFGNIVFFGLGAYSTGVLMVKFNTTFLPSMIFGVGLCLFFTLIFGLPVLRLKGHYFAIATLGLNEATKALVDNLTGLTGGGMGLSLPLVPGDVETNSRYFYFMFLGTMVLCLFVTHFLMRSRFGYAIRSIRSNERSAEGMGINTTQYKVMAWMISAGFTSIAGSLYAYWMSHIEPAIVFDMAIAIKSFVMFLLGGTGTILGPILGAFILETVSTFAWSHLLNYHLATLGAIIILIVIFMPRGVVFFLKERFFVSNLIKKIREERTF